MIPFVLHVMRFFFCAAVLLMLLLTFHAAGASVVQIPIHGTIDGGLAEFVDRGLSHASDEKASVVIFHVDTPGGKVDSAIRIKDAILDSAIPTVAYIDKSAISAGALISIACDSIFMAPGASIGAATAVDMQGKKASEKVISFFRAQMRATAETNGRRPDIAEAMVDEKLVVEGFSEEGSLLTLTANEAVAAGYNDSTFVSRAQLLAYLGLEDAVVEELEVNWAENVVRALTHPIVSSLLLSLGMLGLLIEIRTPGWGIGGTIALIALALFFGSHYIVRLASVIDLLLFVAGIVLLLLEVFVIPGFGIAGVSGIALIVLSLYLSLIGKISFSYDYTRALYIMGGAIGMTMIFGAVVVRYLPRSTLFRHLILDTEETVELGYSSASTAIGLESAQGTALTTLRPSGKADINGRKYDVVTDGEFIQAGAPVRVVESRGARIVVTEVKND